ncbi:MAG: hypothetical protein LBV11_03010 [Bacillus cereus]|jgi:hypothetical protein|nr:hypothetical protein [Bacillus cereus]
MIHSYNFDGKKIFEINNNADKPESFDRVVQYFKDKKQINVFEYKPPFWNTGIFKFEIENINVNLIFRDFGGLELEVKEDLNENELKKVYQWVDEIYNMEH